MKILVVGGGDRPESALIRSACDWAELVMAADKGAEWLVSAGRLPDVLLGDFDSIRPRVLAELKKNGQTNWVQHRVDKDQTDMELCLLEGLRLGATHIRILSATGSRLDHSLANVMLLYPMLVAGVEAWLENGTNRVTLRGGPAETLVDGKMKKAGPYRVQLIREMGYKVSLIALPPGVQEVTTVGLRYDMRARDLKFSATLGVSNEFEREQATITFRSGLLIVTLSQD